jgi:hypothetical protein
MPVRMSIPLRRVGRLLTLLACVTLPPVCQAAREVPVFTVDVADSTPAALAPAMRAVLVRATGHARAASDPQLAALVANAAAYVQGYQHGAAGELQVSFKAAALQQAIRAAGRNLWSADRPFTLIVLGALPSPSQQALAATAVQQAAETRGLPISIVPLTVRDASGRLLPRPSLLAMVHNFGAEQLLIGQDLTPAATPVAPGAAPAPAAVSPPAALAPGASAPAAFAPPGPADTWRWTLVTPFMMRRFTGSVTTGIDATVRLLAPPLAATGADSVVETPVRIEGLQTLDDYAQVETMLAAVPGVHQSLVARLSGSHAVFDLWARGGAAGVSRMLADSPRFRPIGGSGMLAYRYVPPPPPAASPSATPAAAAAPPSQGSPAASPAAPPP